MSSALYITRLRKELRALKQTPVNNIQAVPKENNILEWHYVIEGAKGSPFEGKRVQILCMYICIYLCIYMCIIHVYIY
jgi:ubiquitin-protein ligase